MRHLAKPRDASFFRAFFNPYRYGVLTVVASAILKIYCVALTVSVLQKIPHFIFEAGN